jgi:hypothetical protein
MPNETARIRANGNHFSQAHGLGFFFVLPISWNQASGFKSPRLLDACGRVFFWLGIGPEPGKELQNLIRSIGGQVLSPDFAASTEGADGQEVPAESAAAFIYKAQSSRIEPEAVTRRGLQDRLKRAPSDRELLDFYQEVTDALRADPSSDDGHLAEFVQGQMFSGAFRIAETMLATRLPEDVYRESSLFRVAIQSFGSPFITRVFSRGVLENAVGFVIEESARMLKVFSGTLEGVATIWLARQLVRDPHFDNIPLLIAHLALLPRMPMLPSWTEAIHIYDKGMIKGEYRMTFKKSGSSGRDLKHLSDIARDHTIIAPTEVQVTELTAAFSSWMRAELNQPLGTDASAEPASVPRISIKGGVDQALEQAVALAEHIGPLPVVVDLLVIGSNQQEIEREVERLAERLAATGRSFLGNPLPGNVLGWRVRTVVGQGSIAEDPMPVARALLLPVHREILFDYAMR